MAQADQQFLWSVFQKVDKDQSGQITINELQQALSNGSWEPFNPETCRLMIVQNEDKIILILTEATSFVLALGRNNVHLEWRQKGMFDKEKKGTLSFQDFGALWKYVTDWQGCFRSFDKDGSGSIDSQEMLTALQTFGYRLSVNTVDTIVQKFNRAEKGGKIYFDDFIQACVLLHNITNAFKQFDTDQDGVITIQYEQFINLVFGAGI